MANIESNPVTLRAAFLGADKITLLVPQWFARPALLDAWRAGTRGPAGWC
jgi:hypothetical protein